MRLRRAWVLGLCAMGAAGLTLALGYPEISARAQQREAAPSHDEQATRETQPLEVRRRQLEAPRGAQGRIDPQAIAVVRRMTDYLSALPAFSVTADSMFEIVLRDGEKVQEFARSQVAVQRPDKLRSERRGPLADLTLVYDGREIMLEGHRQNVYAVTNAPDKLDAALDYARDQLNIEAPGADLLYTDVYDGLMHHVRSGRYLGRAEIRGVTCDHVIFHAGKADWQLWVEVGDRPLPRRYEITTRDQRGQPEFAVDLQDWNVSPRFAPNTFAIAPPLGAQRVQFAGLMEGAAEAAKREGEAREEGRGK